MILYSIGKRIKDFIKVTVQYDVKQTKEKVISGDQFLKNNSKIRDGKVCWYYDTGKIKSECHYKNSMLEGISKHYFENGNIKAKETYKENKLNGLSLRYYDNGKLMCEETYRSGTLLSKISFDSEGRKTDEKRS